MRMPVSTRRYKELLVAYGPVAVAFHLTVWSTTLLCTFAAISLGVDVGGLGSAGALGAAWMVTQLLHPLRTLLTIAVTPALGRGWQTARARWVVARS